GSILYFCSEKTGGKSLSAAETSDSFDSSSFARKGESSVAKETKRIRVIPRFIVELHSEVGRYFFRVEFFFRCLGMRSTSCGGRAFAISSAESEARSSRSCLGDNFLIRLLTTAAGTLSRHSACSSGVRSLKCSFA